VQDLWQGYAPVGEEEEDEDEDEVGVQTPNKKHFPSLKYWSSYSMCAPYFCLHREMGPETHYDGRIGGMARGLGSFEVILVSVLRWPYVHPPLRLREQKGPSCGLSTSTALLQQVSPSQQCARQPLLPPQRLRLRFDLVPFWLLGSEQADREDNFGSAGECSGERGGGGACSSGSSAHTSAVSRGNNGSSSRGGAHSRNSTVQYETLYVSKHFMLRNTL
jgi:hypothetical protein